MRSRGKRRAYGGRSRGEQHRGAQAGAVVGKGHGSGHRRRACRHLYRCRNDHWCAGDSRVRNSRHRGCGCGCVHDLRDWGGGAGAEARRALKDSRDGVRSGRERRGLEAGGSNPAESCAADHSVPIEEADRARGDRRSAGGHRRGECDRGPVGGWIQTRGQQGGGGVLHILVEDR